MLNMSLKPSLALLFSVALIFGGCGGPGSETEDETETEIGNGIETETEPGAEPGVDPDRTAGGTDERQDATQEEAAPAETDPADTEVIPSGTQMDLTLESTLSTQESEVGDVFSTRVTDDVAGPDGEVLIPEGAEVRGQVVESREASSPEEEAVLAISLEVLEVDGREYPIQASVTDIELETSEADTPTRSAITVATGAAAGATLGQILGGDTRSTLQGLVAGAVAGTAVALATREGHAVLEEGSRMVVQLEEAVSMSP